MVLFISFSKRKSNRAISYQFPRYRLTSKCLTGLACLGIEEQEIINKPTTPPMINDELNNTLFLDFIIVVFKIKFFENITASICTGDYSFDFENHGWRCL